MVYTGKKIAENIIYKMALAIQDFEGGNSYDRNMRNNNPGNLRWFNEELPNWMLDRGAIGLDEENHVIFDTYENGLSALEYQIEIAMSGKSSVYNPSMTIYAFFSRYAEANQISYAEFVANKLGVSPDTTLLQLSTLKG